MSQGSTDCIFLLRLFFPSMVSFTLYKMQQLFSHALRGEERTSDEKEQERENLKRCGQRA